MLIYISNFNRRFKCNLESSSKKLISIFENVNGTEKNPYEA